MQQHPVPNGRLEATGSNSVHNNTVKNDIELDWPVNREDKVARQAF
jgi:hypothetical protein